MGMPAVGAGTYLRHWYHGGGICERTGAERVVQNGVWDYSGLWGNLLGQICPQFWALWCALSVPAIVLLDWMRYVVEGGDKPFYKF